MITTLHVFAAGRISLSDFLYKSFTHVAAVQPNVTHTEYAYKDIQAIRGKALRSELCVDF